MAAQKPTKMVAGEPRQTTAGEPRQMVRVRVNPERVRGREQVRIPGAADGGGDLVVTTDGVTEISPEEWDRVKDLRDGAGRAYLVR